MSNFFVFLKIGSFLITFLAVFLPMYADYVVNPEIEISVLAEQEENFTKADITIKNSGFSPATNLRVTINPEYDIIDYGILFSTEKITLSTTGPLNLIAEMERLANDQKIIITTTLDSTSLSNFAVFATHDSGSTTYYYNKDTEKQFDIVFFLTLLTSIIVALAIGISSNVIIRRYESKTQIADRGGVNLQDITNSSFTIHTGEPQPIKSEEIISEKSKYDTIKELLKRIGTEKISNLLQEAKIIAIETQDKEMQAWIELELNGFEVPSGKKLTRKEAKEKGLLPDYRDIKGKFSVQFSDGSLREMNYPILFGNSLKNVENSIEKIKKGGRAFIQHTFPKDTQLIGGQTGDLDLPSQELERIIDGVERKLSQYLESKLTRS